MAVLATSSNETEQPTAQGDSLLVGVSFVIGLTVVQRLVGFGRSLLFCRVMDDDELGRWSLAFSFLVLAAPLAVVGIPGCFGRYVEHYRQRKQLKTFLKRTALTSIILASIGITILVAVPSTIAKIVFNDASMTSLVYLLAATLACVLVFNFLIELLTALRHIRAVSIVHFTSSIFFATMAVGLLACTHWREEAVLGGYAIGTGLASIIGGIMLARAWRSIDDEDRPLRQKTMWSKLLPFAMWLWVSNLVGNLFNASDRFMILHLSPSEWNAEALIGQYHASRIIPVLLTAVASTLCATLLPYASQHWESGDRKRVSTLVCMSFKLIGLLLTCGGAAVLLASPILFGWLLQGKYDAGLAVLPLTMVYCIWLGLLGTIELYLFCRERTRWISFTLALGLVANVGLNFVLLPTFGLQGAVLATLCGNGIALGTMTFVCHRLGLKLDRGVLCIALLPLALLAGPIFGATAIVVVLIASATTSVVFAAEQRRELTTVIQQVLQRLPRFKSKTHVATS